MMNFREKGGVDVGMMPASFLWPAFISMSVVYHRLDKWQACEFLGTIYG